MVANMVVDEVANMVVDEVANRTNNNIFGKLRTAQYCKCCNEECEYTEWEYKYITQHFGLLQTHHCYFEPPHLHKQWQVTLEEVLDQDQDSWCRWPLRRSLCGWLGWWLGMVGGGVSKPKVRIVWIITLSCQDKDKDMEVMGGVWWLSAHINYHSVPFLK